MEPWEPHVSASALVRLRTLVELVNSSPHNLVSPRARQSLWTRHVPECLALRSLVPAHATTVLDVGSGGGFPGLVMASVLPDLDFRLLEATGKKAAFLREAAHAMRLSRVVVVHDRAESVVADWRGEFDVVTARAVAPLERLVGWTVPFLSPSGVVLAIKGERWRAELHEAAGAIQRHRAKVVATPDDRMPAVEGAAEWAPRVVTLARRESDTPGRARTS